MSLSDRLERYHNCGLVAGKIGAMIMAVDYLLFLFLEWLLPPSMIDQAPTFDHGLFKDYTRSWIKEQKP